MNGIELILYVGYYSGDFVEVFNFGDGEIDSYVDYGVSIVKDGFSFVVIGMNLDDVGVDVLDNDELKFIVVYLVDFEF